MTLPHIERAEVEEKKIREYLLNLAHPTGGSKAKFFRGRGFNDTAWQVLRAALIEQARRNPVADQSKDEYGQRFVVDCYCPTPDGSNPCIRTVWEVTPKNPCPRLITAHPNKK